MEHIFVPLNFDSSCYYDEANQIRFDPPVYEQRYSTVLQLLDLDYWKHSFKKIVEFGCAEMKFFRLLRSLAAVEKILEIDIDERLLNQHRNMVKPLLVDYVTPPENPFTVEVWRGDISVEHECLVGTDVVIGIEIIEHLHQPVLDKVPENVFGFIKPKVAFFSTPNAEFNVLFDGLLENGFRHDDHKFEWTRAQFETWAGTICQRYPDYDVKYFGIGAPPAGSEAIGCVSQLAVFVRKDFLSSLPEPPMKEPLSTATVSRQTDEPPAGEPSKRACWFNPETGEVMTDPPPNVHDDDGTDGPACVQGPPGGEMDEGWRMNDDLDIDDQWSSGEEQQESDISGGGQQRFEMYIPDHEDVLATRTRNDSGNFEEEEEPRTGAYWMIHREEYPVAAPDDRTAEQRLRDDVLYQVRRLRNFGEDFLDPEQDMYLIPLYAVRNCMGAEQVTIEQLRRILPAEGYRINADDMVCLPVEYSSDDDVDDCAEYDIDDPFEQQQQQQQGWDEEDGEANACPNRAVQGLSLAEDDATWD